MAEVVIATHVVEAVQCLAITVAGQDRYESLQPRAADGFYARRKTARPKLSFAIAMKDGRPFAFAGLWEGWKDPESGDWLRTCTIITCKP